MAFQLNRRGLLALGALGAGAFSARGAAQFMARQGFTHGVASGEPTSDSVLLWTRFVAANDVTLRAEVARDLEFSRIIAGGEVAANGDADHTAKITIGSLPDDSWLYYRFIGPDGQISPAGRTRTLPAGDIARFGIGLFSCSNLPFGWFNAYGHAAARQDLDLLIHCGDYLYEYGAGTYPSTRLALPGRDIQPSGEIIALADYRLRYASYRVDPDLLKLHAGFPMIARWDDHEIADNPWMEGANNHQEDTEGDWQTRKAAAMRAYHEWMPVSDSPWDSYQIGTLATIFLPETRLHGRVKQLSLREALRDQPDLERALTEFRDGPWSSPGRTILGVDQERSLYRAMGASSAAGTHWQILAQQMVMGQRLYPSEAIDWLPATASQRTRDWEANLIAANKAGVPYDYDAWDGYPAARSRLFHAALDGDCDLVVLSGDSHNAWGNNLRQGQVPVGVEFAGQSVTSPGFEGYMGHVPSAELANALRRANRDIAFCDTSRRGYLSLDVTPESITGHWHFLRTVREQSLDLAETKTMQVRKHIRVLEDI